MEQQIFYKIEFTKKISDHEQEVRILYCDDYDAQRTEHGTLFYICRFSDGSQKTICCDQFDDFHVIVLYRNAESPE